MLLYGLLRKQYITIFLSSSKLHERKRNKFLLNLMSDFKQKLVCIYLSFFFLIKLLKAVNLSAEAKCLLFMITLFCPQRNYNSSLVYKNIDIPSNKIWNWNPCQLYTNYGSTRQKCCSKLLASGVPPDWDIKNLLKITSTSYFLSSARKRF